MKYEKEFEAFLNQDMCQDYYYKISSVNKIFGNKGMFFEIFVDNIDEIEDKEDVIIERFYDYLTIHNINCDIEDLFYNFCDYVSVYDTEEFCEN